MEAKTGLARTVPRSQAANGAARNQETPAVTNNPRLTERDRAALTYVTALRAVRLDDLAVLLAALAGRGGNALGPRTTRDVVARWRTLGLATVDPYPGQGPGVVLPTARAAAITRQARPKPPSWTDTPHTLTTAAVAARYLAHAGGSWRAETLLRASLPKGEHLPDGVWQPLNGAAVVPVEVERNGKAADRWASIAAHLLSRYATTHYWLTENTRPAWERWAGQNLTAADQGRIHVYSIDAQGVGR